MKLTSKEQAFAAQNHKLVSEYLECRHLSEDEYYDVVIFKYLRAVNSYLENEELQKAAFCTIAYEAMDSAISNYRKSYRSQKRRAVVLSLDYPVNYSGTLTFQDILPDNGCNVCEQICEKQALDTILQAMNHPYQEMISLKLSGYSNREIAQIYAVALSDINRCFRNMEEIICDLEMAV